MLRGTSAIHMLSAIVVLKEDFKVTYRSECKGDKMSRYSLIELTNMCMVYNNKGEVLVQNKVGDETWCGLTFPGGKII